MRSGEVLRQGQVLPDPSQSQIGDLRQLPAAAGLVAALTLHRSVIHYHDCASLTPRGEPRRPPAGRWLEQVDTHFLKKWKNIP